MTDHTVRRAELIEQMELHYARRAWSDRELADELGVNRTTVYRARRVMEDEQRLPLYEESRGRYRLHPSYRLDNLKLNPLEALALYLGGRRLQQQTRTAHGPTATALQKLSAALRPPLGPRLERAADEVRSQEGDPEHDRVLAELLEGWTTGRRVHVVYRSYGAEAARTHRVAPYQIEPSVWGDGVYVIGHSDLHDDVITLKTSRMERASVTAEPFAVPPGFDSHALLEHAWGIWHADGPPQAVRLRFSPAVTGRVKETIWHPSQTIRDLPGGGCEWQAEIADVREMEPWVRGWGADVEVLAPAALREMVVDHVARLAALYGLDR